MPHHRIRLLLSIVTLVSVAAIAEADDPQPKDTEVQSPASAREIYERRVNAAARDYLETVRAARKVYVETLDASMRKATQDGDLDRTLELRRERQIQEKNANQIPSPLAAMSPEVRAKGRFRVEPAPAVALDETTLTARPWYIFHRTGIGHQEVVIRLEPGGKMKFLEGAEATRWDENQPKWEFQDGHLTLSTETGVLAHFEAVPTIMLRSRESDEHRFFWISPAIIDPFLKPTQ